MSDNAGRGPLVGALALGVLVGAGAVGILAAMRIDSQPPVTTPDAAEATCPPLEIACLPLMRRTAEYLDRAQTRVNALEIQIRDKQQEVSALEGSLSTSGDRSSAVEIELREARNQLTVLEANLQAAKEEKTNILTDLLATREQLAGTRTALAAAEEQARVAIEETANQRWESFVRNAQLSVCNQGTKERMDHCRAETSRAMEPYALRFKACSRSGQAIPELRSVEAGKDLPRFGVSLAKTGLLADWYVLFCDPVLPEANADSPLSP